MAQVSVGVDPLKVQLQLPAWQRVRQVFARSQPADFVKAFGLMARLDVPADDEGSVEAQFLLVNHLGRSVYPDRLEIQSWTWMSYLLPELPFTARGLGQELRKHSDTFLWLSFQLNVAAIRRLRAAMPADAPQLLLGNYPLVLQATLQFRGTLRPAVLSLQFPHPHLRLCWLLRTERTAE